MVRRNQGDSLRKPPKATISTTDRAKFLAWVVDMESKGYVEVSEHEEFLNMLANMTKAQELQRNGVLVTVSKKGNKVVKRQAYDPATVANRPSGNGQKPMPKPTRDYKGAGMPKGPWTPDPRLSGRPKKG
jgi:hypothetical protein